MFSLFLTIQSHSYHKSKIISSANFLSGGVYEKLNNVSEYFNLRTIDWDFECDESPLLLIENQQKEFTIVRKSGGFKNGKLMF